MIRYPAGRPIARAAVATAMLACSAGAFALTQTFGGSPYTSFADSPFAVLGLSSFQLEDFEDGLLNSTGVSATTGGSVIGPQAQADSVDADDGIIDGSGAAGRSFFSNGLTTALTFVFDSVALGGLPTHVGVVWTDVGLILNAGGTLGVSDLVVQAYDGADQLIDTLGQLAIGDGSTFGQTAEDRFFGFRHDAGIARLLVSMPNSNDFEIDHLQYGFAAVPLPASVALLLPALLMLGGQRRAAR